MELAPVLSVEMVTSSRRLRYFLVRVAYACILFAALLVNYEASNLRWGQVDSLAIAQFGAAFFTTFTFVQLVAVMILAPAIVGGTISQEYEGRTIEFLLSSQLSSTEIVLSKFVSRTAQVVVVLAVGLPFLALMMLLGGIEPERLLIVFLVTLLTLLALSAVALLVSVWTLRGRDAVARLYALLLVALIAPPMLAGLRGIIPQRFAWLEWLPWLASESLRFNPFAVLIDLWSGAFSRLARGPWETVLPLCTAEVVLCVVALTLAIVSLRPAHRQMTGGTRRRRKDRLVKRRGPGRRAMLWKELYMSSSGLRWGWAARIGVGIIVLVVLTPFIVTFVQLMLEPGANQWLPQILRNQSAFSGTMVECGILLIIAARAAGSVAGEREKDTWVSLIGTPLQPSEIVWSKILGSIYAARWLLLPLVMIWGLQLFVDPRFAVNIPFLVAPLAIVALFVSALGVWFSMWCRTSLRAMAATVAIVVVCGGAYLFCCFPIAIGSGADENVAFLFAPCIPYLLTAPALAWVEPGQPIPDEPELLIAFLLGTGGYLVAGLTIASATIGDFARLAGRMEGETLPTWSTPGPIQPQVPGGQGPAGPANPT